MVTKSQVFGYTASAEKQPRLTAAMRACVSWAALEEHDKVLDMACGSGALLNYLNQRQRLTLCGICGAADQARTVSEQLGGADVMAARMEDIPWRDDTFHAVLLPSSPRGDVRRVLDEALRVLRPGGQFVMAAPMLPFRGEGETSRRELMRVMQEAGYRDVSFRSGWLSGVLIGWKPSEIDAG